MSEQFHYINLFIDNTTFTDVIYTQSQSTTNGNIFTNFYGQEVYDDPFNVGGIVYGSNS